MLSSSVEEGSCYKCLNVTTSLKSIAGLALPTMKDDAAQNIVLFALPLSLPLCAMDPPPPPPLPPTWLDLPLLLLCHRDLGGGWVGDPLFYPFASEYPTCVPPVKTEIYYIPVVFSFASSDTQDSFPQKWRWYWCEENIWRRQICKYLFYLHKYHADPYVYGSLLPPSIPFPFPKEASAIAAAALS